MGLDLGLGDCFFTAAKRATHVPIPYIIRHKPTTARRRQKLSAQRHLSINEGISIHAENVYLNVSRETARLNPLFAQQSI